MENTEIKNEITIEETQENAIVDVEKNNVLADVADVAGCALAIGVGFAVGFGIVKTYKFVKNKIDDHRLAKKLYELDDEYDEFDVVFDDSDVE